MAGNGLFGRRAVGAVAIVEAPVSQSYARKARLAFLTVSAGGAVFAATVLAAVLPLVQAVPFGALAGVAAGLVMAVLVRVWPVLRVLWWWAGEVAAAVLLLESSAFLARAMHPLVAIGLLAVLAVVAAALRPVRRFVTAWGWCAIVRHRLRLCFAEVIRSANRARPASLPLILWARPTPAGERVWLWLRPGLDLEELEGRTARLAVACWASEVRLCRASTRYAALLRVDVARRDPLTGLVASPLVDLLPGWLDAPAPVSPAMPPAGLDLADLPEEPPEPPRSGRR